MVSDDSGSRGRSEQSPSQHDSGNENPNSLYLWARDSAFAVVLVALLLGSLVLIGGAWPPMSAVESASMDPNLEVGDMVIVSEPERFASDSADENGVLTHAEAQDTGEKSFGGYGTVIVFKEPGSSGSEIIHRVRFRVEEGENWFDRAEEEFLNGAESCSELRNCPAPNDGYITKGDNNDYYDQAIGAASPVKGEWISATPEISVPYVGWFRLISKAALISTPAGI